MQYEYYNKKNSDTLRLLLHLDPLYPLLCDSRLKKHCKNFHKINPLMEHTPTFVYESSKSRIRE